MLARRLHALVGELTGSSVPLGDLDISFYRDDLVGREPGAQPVVHGSHLDFDLDGRTVVLVDDVLFTGRTVRAAIDALFDYGRPDRVQLAVLADRGHRELPIRPDYVGKNLPTARDERVFVRLEETDGVDEVTIGRADGRNRDPGRAMRHLLSIEDLERADIERIMERAASFAEVGRRDIKKVPTLRGRTIVSLFYESSTRTSSSFELAAKRLSADVVSVKSARLLGRQGRVAEGHDRDPLRLRAGGDRHPLARTPARRSWSPAGRDAAVINAGDGKHEHPSQALLDAYTLLERFGSLEAAARRPRAASGSGSSATSSTAASPAPARSAFGSMGAEVTVCGPPTLIPRGIEEALGCEVAYTLDELGEADVVYALRMQRERMNDTFVPSIREYATNYQIDSRRLGPAPAAHAPGPGQPRRRALARGDRRPRLADHRPRSRAAWWSGWRSSTSCSPAAASRGGATAGDPELPGADADRGAGVTATCDRSPRSTGAAATASRRRRS